jgi:hypothetical protein
MSRPAKLPVWKTTRECYHLVFTHLGDFFRISWLWILVMIPVYMLAHATVWLLTESPDRLSDSLRFKMLAGCIPSVIEAYFLATIAVAWHQLILRAHTPTTAPLRLDTKIMTYALWAFAVFLLPMFAWLGLFPEPSAKVPTGNEVMTHVAHFFLIPLISILPLRFSLKFPAIALTEPMSLAQSWWQTRGNSMRLSLTALVCWLPPVLALIPLAFALPDISEQPSLIAFVTVGIANSYAYALPAILGVTWLSLVYRHFVLTPHPLDSQGNLP